MIETCRQIPSDIPGTEMLFNRDILLQSVLGADCRVFEQPLGLLSKAAVVQKVRCDKSGLEYTYRLNVLLRIFGLVR